MTRHLPLAFFLAVLAWALSVAPVLIAAAERAQ